MTEQYTLYGHDGQGNLKSEQTVILPSGYEKRSVAEREAMTDPGLFYTLVKNGKVELSSGPVGWRSKFGERIPEYNPT